MGLSAEVASSSRAHGICTPLKDSELGIAALNDKPVIWVVGDSSTDFTSEFLKSCHAVALAWQVSLWSRIITIFHILISLLPIAATTPLSASQAQCQTAMALTWAD
jgi:hypothetical protein